MVKAFDTLSALEVTLTQKWALTAAEKVAKRKMDNLGNRVKMMNFSTTHDNLNRMFRVSHQRIGHNSHLDSGYTATVLSAFRTVNCFLQELFVRLRELVVSLLR